MNFVKDNLILLAMPICLLVIFLIQKLEDESRAGSCCEVDKDEKPSASPHVIQKAIEVGWTEEQIETLLAIANRVKIEAHKK